MSMIFDWKCPIRCIWLRGAAILVPVMIPIIPAIESHYGSPQLAILCDWIERKVGDIFEHQYCSVITRPRSLACWVIVWLLRCGKNFCLPEIPYNTTA